MWSMTTTALWQPVSRAEMRAHNLQHRAVSTAVLGSDGRLLVHRRSATKDVWPGMWDLAAGGVVAASETYDDAARREAVAATTTRRHVRLINDSRPISRQPMSRRPEHRVPRRQRWL